MTLSHWLTTQPNRCPDGYAAEMHPYLCACTEIATRKSAGIDAANSAPADVKARVDRAILRLARSGEEFSANDLRRELEGVPGPVVGARFNLLGRQGLIVQTNRRVPSNKASTNGHEIKCWKGRAA